MRDAHNLYLGTLADLGLLGLIILVAVLVLPLAAARRTRDPLLTAVLASYSGFLVHAAFEWNWKFPVLTVAALVFAALLVVSDPVRPALQIGNAGRIAATGLTALAAAFALAVLIGNTSVMAAEKQAAAGDGRGAAARADRARAFLPWASEPWLVLADSRAERGDAAGRRAALREAVARDRNDWTLWFRLAALARGGERVFATRRVLALNPRLGAR